MDDSYKSVSLEEYTCNVSDCLCEYDIQETKQKGNYIIYKGTIRSSSQRIKIFKRPFNERDFNQRNRFNSLMSAFNQGIVLADNIFIGQDRDNCNKKYYSYVIEPWFKTFKRGNNSKGGTSRFKRLKDILIESKPERHKMQRLFQNLVITLSSLHQIGEAHLDINPKNIWIEDNFLVYLRPFQATKQQLIQSESQQNLRNLTSLFYRSPEMYYAASQLRSQEGETITQEFAQDLWALGCVFAELFFSQTPLFLSSSFEQIGITYFVVLGIPESDESWYIPAEEYSKCCDILIEKSQTEDLPVLKHIIKNISASESEVLTCLLEFDPNKRVSCQQLLKYPFFQKHLSSPNGQNNDQESTKWWMEDISDRKNEMEQIKSSKKSKRLQDKAQSQQDNKLTTDLWNEDIEMDENDKEQRQKEQRQGQDNKNNSNFDNFQRTNAYSSNLTPIPTSHPSNNKKQTQDKSVNNTQNHQEEEWNLPEKNKPYQEYTQQVSKLCGRKDKLSQQLEINQAKKIGASCVLKISINKLSDFQLSLEGVRCRVDIPYENNQKLSIESFISEKSLDSNQKYREIEVELTQAFDFQNLKKSLLAEPIQISLINPDTTVLVHAFVDLSILVLNKHSYSSEILWDKPLTQWKYLINPMDTMNHHGKIKIISSIAVLKSEQKQKPQKLKASHSASFSVGYSAPSTIQKQQNRSFQGPNNHSFYSSQQQQKKLISNIKNKVSAGSNKPNESITALQKIQQDLSLLDEEMKQKERSEQYKSFGLVTSQSRGGYKTMQTDVIFAQDGEILSSSVPSLQQRLQVLLRS